MGGGSTGLACLETGRGFIGIELSPEYYEIASARLAGGA
ncbi:MAG: DNA methyltransferase [Humidesulfovibrio sp.]